MIWLLGGAHSLDIAGTASETPRPPDTVDVGQDWPHYGGDPGGHRYSQADQITTANVTRLAPVWEYRTGDMTTRADHMNQTATQGTPILVNDALVFCTPFNEVIALGPGRLAPSGGASIPASTSARIPRTSSSVVVSPIGAMPTRRGCAPTGSSWARTTRV